jgi:hypothetical protein
MPPDLDLTKFKVLSFDCYGTLIDWEAGIAAVLASWAREQGVELGDEELLLAYADNEAAVERQVPAPGATNTWAVTSRRSSQRRTSAGTSRPRITSVRSTRRCQGSAWIGARCCMSPRASSMSMGEFADAVDEAFTLA